MEDRRAVAAVTTRPSVIDHRAWQRTERPLDRAGQDVANTHCQCTSAALHKGRTNCTRHVKVRSYLASKVTRIRGGFVGMNGMAPFMHAIWESAEDVFRFALEGLARPPMYFSLGWLVCEWRTSANALPIPRSWPKLQPGCTHMLISFASSKIARHLHPPFSIFFMDSFQPPSQALTLFHPTTRNPLKPSQSQPYSPHHPTNTPPPLEHTAP